VTKLKTVQHGELALLFCAFIFFSVSIRGLLHVFLFLGFLFASNSALRFGFPFPSLCTFAQRLILFLWGRSGLLVPLLFWFGLRLFLVLLFGNGVCMYGTLDGQNGFCAFTRVTSLRAYDDTTFTMLRCYEVTIPTTLRIFLLLFLLRFILHTSTSLVFFPFSFCCSKAFDTLLHIDCKHFLLFIFFLFCRHISWESISRYYCYNHVGSSPKVHPGGGSMVDYFMGLTELTTSVTGFFCYIFFVHLLCSQIDS
jgi:hypothetical protein